MDKILKNIINKTIEREYQNFSEKGYEGALKRSPEETEYHEECSKKMDFIMVKLYAILPKEHQNLVDEFEDAALGLVSSEARIVFKEGVIIGATDPKYLGEELDIELQCI